MNSCKERIENVIPKTVYQLRETLFDNLELFDIPDSEDRKLFKNLAIFDFVSICVQRDKLLHTDAITWTGKYIPKSVSIPSNLIEEPIFLRNSTPGALFESFFDVPDRLATQSKAQLKLNFSGD